MAVQSFVGLLLAYMKFFDGKTTDEDPENFYMEREWRIYGNLEFDIADVYRVFLPREYASRFRADFPGYLGQLSFV
jgi:hypothetical protein